MRTDPAKLAGCGNTEIAKILARDIDAGKSNAVEYVGPSFADYQGREIERQINTRSGNAERLIGEGVLPEVAEAIATAIKAAKERT